MYHSFYIVLFLAVYSSASRASKDLNNGEVPENQSNSSFVDFLFTEKYLTLSSYENFVCPDLTKPDCETKVATNIMLNECEVCLSGKNLMVQKKFVFNLITPLISKR